MHFVFNLRKINSSISIFIQSNKKVATRSTSGRSGGGAATEGWYRVRQGDTLEKIARRNGTTVKRLCQLNNIKETKVLHPGDRLRVSGSVPKSNAKPAANSGNNGGSNVATKSGNSNVSGGTNRPATPSAPTATTYTVRSGDTLYKIARRHGTTVQRLCQLNGITENTTLRIGQKLKLK